MITVKGIDYHNDLDKKSFNLCFRTLGDLFTDLKERSNNFASKGNNYFPTRKNESDFSWCNRIEVDNFNNHYRHHWIYEIDNDDGILYSDGHYTRDIKHCSQEVETWLKNCKEAVFAPKFNFIE